MSVSCLSLPGGQSLEVDEKGYLIDWMDWSPIVAQTMAALDGVILEADHWVVLNIFRDYFQQFEINCFAMAHRHRAAAMRACHARSVACKEVPRQQTAPHRILAVAGIPIPLPMRLSSEFSSPASGLLRTVTGCAASGQANPHGL